MAGWETEWKNGTLKRWGAQIASNGIGIVGASRAGIVEKPAEKNMQNETETGFTSHRGLHRGL